MGRLVGHRSQVTARALGNPQLDPPGGALRRRGDAAHAPGRLLRPHRRNRPPARPVARDGRGLRRGRRPAHGRLGRVGPPPGAAGGGVSGDAPPVPAPPRPPTNAGGPWSPVGVGACSLSPPPVSPWDGWLRSSASSATGDRRNPVTIPERSARMLCSKHPSRGGQAMPATGNHTLVHGLLSIAVGLIYAATVLFLVQLVPVVGGGLSVALSTLAVAALLRPLWRRTQDTVNRRFSGLR